MKTSLRLLAGCPQHSSVAIASVAASKGLAHRPNGLSPPSARSFLQDEVATVAITMDPDSAEAMLFGDVDYASSNPFPATMVYQSTVLDTLIDTVAVRLRGNTSLFAPKKSFKIDLNAFIPGQKFADLEKST